MSRLSKEITRSLAQEWTQGRTIEAKGDGSAARIVVDLTWGFDKSRRELDEVLPMFSQATLVKLLVMSNPDIDWEVDREIEICGVAIPGHKEKMRARLVEEVCKVIEGGETTKLGKQEQVQRASYAEQTERAVRSVVIAMWEGLDKEIAERAKIYPMYSEPTLARILVIACFAIDCTILEERSNCKVHVPGQWEKRKVELEEGVWKVIKEKRGY